MIIVSLQGFLDAHNINSGWFFRLGFSKTRWGTRPSSLKMPEEDVMICSGWCTGRFYCWSASEKCCLQLWSYLLAIRLLQTYLPGECTFFIKLLSRPLLQQPYVFQQQTKCVVSEVVVARTWNSATSFLALPWELWAESFRSGSTVLEYRVRSSI
jgi:hypothetical protein